MEEYKTAEAVIQHLQDKEVFIYNNRYNPMHVEKRLKELEEGC